MSKQLWLLGGVCAVVTALSVFHVSYITSFILGFVVVGFLVIDLMGNSFRAQQEQIEQLQAHVLECKEMIEQLTSDLQDSTGADDITSESALFE